MSFGKIISEARKQAKLSQKDLASKIIKEDGISISPQYLNDIEHDRRKPDSDYLIKQFSNILKKDEVLLFYHSARIPNNAVRNDMEERRIIEAYQAFRKALKS